MADQLTPAEQAILEDRLVELGRSIAYPPTPNIASSVRERLMARAGLTRRLWLASLWPRAVGYGALVLVMGLAAGLALWPEGRTAVADRLGLRGILIEQRTSTSAPVEGSLPLAATLGDVVTLEEARMRAGFPVLVPVAPELGPPDSVHFLTSVSGGQVALMYGARPRTTTAEDGEIGLLIVEFRAPPGSINMGVLGKQLAPDTRIEAIRVNGSAGLWIEGAPHVLYVPDARGEMRAETVRLAGNVLLWEHGEVTLRLEGAASKDVALRLASSMR